MDTEPREFKNVTLYMPGGFWGNIVRIDARRAKIWVGTYAQHKEHVLCECIEKGRRKPISPDCGGYLVVVPTTNAIQPDEPFLHSVPSGDGTYSSAPTRYSMGDSKWRTDFDEQLLAANVPILADYRDLPTGTGTEPSSIQVAEAPVGDARTSPREPATDNQHEDANFEFEEGIRHQAERSFFQRNPQVAQQAREFYGCACKVCGFDFEKAYGPLGENFAEVHHLNPLSERPPDEWTEAVRTNIAEVTVLCANCHRMIHRRKPAFSIEELRAMICAGGGAERRAGEESDRRSFAFTPPPANR
jgi:hypothetical protein